jgi:hypothetical protein
MKVSFVVLFLLKLIPIIRTPIPRKFSLLTALNQQKLWDQLYHSSHQMDKIGRKKTKKFLQPFSLYIFLVYFIKAKTWLNQTHRLLSEI